MKHQGLGRGLDSLIPSRTDRRDIVSPGKTDGNGEDKGAGSVLEISVSEIRPNPMQPRQDFNHRDLEDLINSIREHGIIQPLVVSKMDDHYRLIAGERRFRAAKMLSLPKVPAIIRQAEGDQELLELALIENIQRSDLNPMERARGYRNLMDNFSLTQEEAGKRVGKNRATVANALRLLELPEEIQKALSEGRISEGHAKAILAFEDPGRQLRLFQRILEGGFSVREAENQAKRTRSGRNSSEGKDPNIQEKEERMRGALGTKASISGNSEKGKISIEYYSSEELNSVVDKICS